MKTAVLLLAGTLAVLGWSVVRPHDYFTWFLEVFPFLIALPILLVTARRFPLTPIVYALIALHATILCCIAEIAGWQDCRIAGSEGLKERSERRLGILRKRGGANRAQCLRDG